MPTLLSPYKKPPKWNINPAFIAPEWQWAWENVAIAALFNEGTYRPFNYAVGSFATEMTGGEWSVADSGICLDSRSVNTRVRFNTDFTSDGDLARSFFIKYDRSAGGEFDTLAYYNCGTFNNGQILAGIHWLSTDDWQIFDAATGVAAISLARGSIAASRQVGGQTAVVDSGVHTATISTSNIANDNGSNVQLATAQTDTTGQSVEYHVMFAWNDAKTVGQLRQLHADPFGPFRLDLARLPAIYTQAAAATFQPAWAAFSNRVIQ